MYIICLNYIIYHLDIIYIKMCIIYIYAEQQPKRLKVSAFVYPQSKMRINALFCSALYNSRGHHAAVTIAFYIYYKRPCCNAIDLLASTLI